MKTQEVTTGPGPATNLIRTRGRTNRGRHCLLWLAAVMGLAASIPEAATALPPMYFTVTVCTPTGGSVSPSPGDHLYTSGESVSITATAASGYTFVRWNAGGGVSVANPTAANTTMTVNLGGGTLCPQFAPIPYTVTICTPTNGTVSPSPGDHIYDYGSTISIQATPASCYRFKQWSFTGGVTVTNPTGANTTMKVTGNGNVCPVFEKITYTVTVGTPTNGMVFPNPGEHTYDCGSSVVIDATPAAGCRFARWSFGGGVSVANPTGAHTTMTVSGDGRLCPEFTRSDPAAGPDYYVAAGAKGKNNGSTWTDAFNNLQDALAVAKGGNVLWVAKGVYLPDRGRFKTPGDRRLSFKLISGVSILGGFPAGGGTFAQREPDRYETILSGDLGKPGDANDNSYHVVVASETDANTRLDGLTITGGNADGQDYEMYGGGLFNDSGNLTVVNCLFTGNAADKGGAVFDRASRAKFVECRFVTNSCRIDAGGMLCRHSDTILAYCLFSGNVAARNGGGLFLFDQGKPSIINCRFEGNASNGGSGGGATNDASQPTFVGCVFTGNTAVVGYGGGFFNMNSGQPDYVINCTFSGNTSKSSGAAIADANSPLVVVNSILWGNRTNDGSQLAAFTAGDVEIRYSCIQGGQGNIVLADKSTVNWGSGNITSDPLFVDADGPDNVVGTDDDRLDLAAGSPCLDAGDDKQVPPDIADLDADGNTSERIPLDILGLARFVDNTAAANKGVADPPTYSAIVDMGAYEHAK